MLSAVRQPPDGARPRPFSTSLVMSRQWDTTRFCSDPCAPVMTVNTVAKSVKKTKTGTPKWLGSLCWTLDVIDGVLRPAG